MVLNDYSIGFLYFVNWNKNALMVCILPSSSIFLLSRNPRPAMLKTRCVCSNYDEGHISARRSFPSQRSRNCPLIAGDGCLPCLQALGVDFTKFMKKFTEADCRLSASSLPLMTAISRDGSRACPVIGVGGASPVSWWCVGPLPWLRRRRRV
jgi:hypothetical protein